MIIVYLGLTLVGCMFQDWMMFPGHASQGQKYAMLQSTHDSEIVPLDTSAGDRIWIYFGKAMSPDGLSILPDSASRPTIIFFYGNAMTLSDAVGFCRSWRKMGANAVGVEYPGYGMSSGKPGEAAFYAAADAAYDWLGARGEIDMKKIIPTGLSIGSGVAVELATRKPVAALALFAPYTSMDDLAHGLLPWLPTSLMLRHHFYNERKIGALELPILIAHGTHDSMIPAEMSRQLARAAVRANVTTVFVDADHNDLFERGDAQIGPAMQALIDRVNR